MVTLNNMYLQRWLAIILLSLVTTNAGADMGRKSSKARHENMAEKHDIHDDEVVKFGINVTYVGEPALLPLSLTTNFICKDRRLDRSLVKPSKETLIKDLAICRYDGSNYDSAEKSLVVTYWVSTTMLGEGQCDTRVEQPYNLEELCGEFKP